MAMPGLGDTTIDNNNSNNSSNNSNITIASDASDAANAANAANAEARAALKALPTLLTDETIGNSETILAPMLNIKFPYVNVQHQFLRDWETNNTKMLVSLRVGEIVQLYQSIIPATGPNQLPNVIIDGPIVNARIWAEIAEGLKRGAKLQDILTTPGTFTSNNNSNSNSPTSRVTAYDSGLINFDINNDLLQEAAVYIMDEDGIPTINGIPVWERLEGEEMISYALFKSYRDAFYLQPDISKNITRNYRKLAQFFGIDSRVLEAMHKMYHWNLRCSFFDRYQNQEKQRMKVENVQKMESRHQKLASHLLEEAFDMLGARLEEVPADKLLPVITEMAKLARLSVGLQGDKPGTYQELHGATPYEGSVGSLTPGVTGNKKAIIDQSQIIQTTNTLNSNNQTNQTLNQLTPGVGPGQNQNQSNQVNSTEIEPLQTQMLTADVQQEPVSHVEQELRQLSANPSHMEGVLKVLHNAGAFQQATTHAKQLADGITDEEAENAEFAAMSMLDDPDAAQAAVQGAMDAHQNKKEFGNDDIEFYKRIVDDPTANLED